MESWRTPEGFLRSVTEYIRGFTVSRKRAGNEGPQGWLLPPKPQEDCLRDQGIPPKPDPWNQPLTLKARLRDVLSGVTGTHSQTLSEVSG